MPDLNPEQITSPSRIVDELFEIFAKKEYTDVIDALRPNMRLPFDFSAPEFYELYCLDKRNFFSYVKDAIIKQLSVKKKGFDVATAYSGLKIEPLGQPTIPMQEINPRDNENSVVCFDCQILAVDQRKSYIKEGICLCEICGITEDVKCDPDLKIKPPRCMNRGCSKTPMQLIPDSIKTDYIQNIWLQEPIETSKHSSPVIFIGKLHGSYVGDVFIGQKKRVTGIFKTVIDPKKSEHDIIIEVICINDLEDSEIYIPSKEDIAILKKKSLEPNFLDNIISSYAPSIYGHEKIKLTCLIHLASGVPSGKRREINVALFGDPSMAKSEILKFTSKVAYKSKYTSGKGSSGAGLTIGMVKERESLIPMAGVLPLHTRGFVQIDEFDKMRTEDRSSMHEVMEQGTCSIAKAGVNLTLEAKCSILAAANPKYGKYDEDLTIADNINLPPALLSRFDIIWLITDKVDTIQDLAKAQHILKSFRDQTKLSTVNYSEREIMGYLNYIRNLKPTLNDDVAKKIEKFYQKMRNTSINDKDSLPVGIRQLESIIRMSQAHAKLHFRTEVSEVDIEKVFGLLEDSYKSFSKNLTDDDWINTDITGYTTSTMTKEKMANTIWNKLSDKTKEENIYMPIFTKELAKTDKFDIIDAQKWFLQWEQEGVILKNKNGSYRKS